MHKWVSMYRRGCDHTLEMMASGSIMLGSYYAHEPGGSPSWLFRVRTNKTASGWAVVKVGGQMEDRHLCMEAWHLHGLHYIFLSMLTAHGVLRSRGKCSLVKLSCCPYDSMHGGAVPCTLDQSP